MGTEPHTPLPSPPGLFSCNVKTGSYLRLRNTTLRPQETTATPRDGQCVHLWPVAGCLRVSLHRPEPTRSIDKQGEVGSSAYTDGKPASWRGTFQHVHNDPNIEQMETGDLNPCSSRPQGILTREGEPNSQHAWWTQEPSPAGPKSAAADGSCPAQAPQGG